MNPEPPQWDVFLSYNSDDQAAVRTVAAYLHDEAKVQPWFDEWSLIPGETLTANIYEGLQASKSAAVFFGPTGVSPWHVQESREALSAARKRDGFRLIPVLLPGVPAEPNLPPFFDEFLRVDLRRGLDDVEGLWRLECGVRGKPPGRGAPARERAARSDSRRDLPLPGGTIDPESPCYVRRASDDKVLGEVLQARSMVTVRGPRQIGKTSLMVRVRADLLRLDRIRACFVDLQSFAEADFDSLDTFWRAVTRVVQLQLGDQQRLVWDLTRSYDENLTRFLDRRVFDADPRPLLVCMDEVDRLLAHNRSEDVFASLRSFFNRGAHDGTWRQVRWLLGTSAEPSLFIRDLAQSPFNIGLRVEIEPFSRAEVVIFARALNVALDDPALLDQIHRFTGGAPYLIHVLLNALRNKTVPLAQLLNGKTASGGLFTNHLNRYKLLFQQTPDVREALRQVFEGAAVNDTKLVTRLEAAGLVARDASGTLVPQCELYSQFFGEFFLGESSRAE